jgi:hypothetical protein
MALLNFLLGAALIAGAVRLWRPRVGWRAVAGYLLVTVAFFAVPLATATLQVPTDIAYLSRPWKEMVEPDLRPRNALLSDVPLQMLPFRTLVRDRLLHFPPVPPLWAHEIGTGQPLLGNAQSAPYAPLHLLALGLPPLRALTVAAALQVFLALLLTHALAAALGAGRAGAAFAALGFAFSAYAVCWCYYPLGMAAAWVPGVMLGLLLLRRGERGGLSGLVACGAGLALSGHPETLAHTALACAAVALALLACRAGVPRRRFAGKLAAAAALSACLAAPALLPIVEAVRESVRQEVVVRNPDSVSPPRFAGRLLAVLVDPLFFGSPRDDNWSPLAPANFNELCSGYAGLLALALAAAAAAALRGRALALFAAGLAALLASLGIAPFFALVNGVPGLEHAAHARLRLFWVLAVSLAAGLGLDRLAERRSGRWLGAGAAAAAVLALALLPPPPAPWQLAWWIAALAGGGVAALALALPRAGPLFPWAALACLAVDLGLLGFRYQPLIPAQMDLAPPAALGFLMAEARATADPFRVLAEQGDLTPNLAALYGLWDPRGNDPMQPAAAALVVGRGFQPRFRTGREIVLAPRRYPLPLLDFLGARYFLVAHYHRLPPPLEPVWNGTGGKVWRNPRALPLFFMPSAVISAGDRLAAVRRTLALPDFAAAAVVEDGPAGVPAGSPASLAAGAAGMPSADSPAAHAALLRRLAPPPAPQAGTVRLLRVRPNGFDLDIESATGGVVVSSVSWAGGWRAVVDGQATPPRRVNGGFLGFAVARGHHRVALDYRPASWTWGLRLFALGIAGSLLAAVTIARAHRSNRPRLMNVS